MCAIGVFILVMGYFVGYLFSRKVQKNYENSKPKFDDKGSMVFTEVQQKKDENADLNQNENVDQLKPVPEQNNLGEKNVVV